jgi:prepilin signal peptidase PulO-like enzyme (type II secretory pathway)
LAVNRDVSLSIHRTTPEFVFPIIMGILILSYILNMLSIIDWIIPLIFTVLTVLIIYLEYILRRNNYFKIIVNN